MFNPFATLTNKILCGLLLAALLWGGIATITGHQWRATARRANDALAKVVPAQALARARAEKAIADTEAKYKGIADEAQSHRPASASAARADADGYAVAHRVPACNPGGIRGASAAAESGSAVVPTDLSASSIVADADLRACSAAAAYAIDAHDWAVKLSGAQ